MSAPAYIVKKVGDRYIPVLQDSNRTLATTCYVAGGLLVGYAGVRRRGLSGLAAAGAGAYLIARGVLGYDPSPILRDWIRPSSGGSRSGGSASYANDHGRPSQQTAADSVDEAAMESFPASDPPAYSKADSAK